MENAANRTAWVQWRCDALLELNRQVRDRIQRVRPDCQLYLDIAYPYRHTEDEMMTMARDGETLRRQREEARLRSGGRSCACRVSRRRRCLGRLGEHGQGKQDAGCDEYADAEMPVVG